jgi:hypothetical protein
MTKKKIAVSLLALTTTSLLAATASADYFCNASYRPYSSTYGNAGFITATVYSGPDCTGSLVGTRIICTTGATSTSCPVASFHRTDSQLQADVMPILYAIDKNVKFLGTYAVCIGGASGCFVAPNFYAN